MDGLVFYLGIARITHAPNSYSKAMIRAVCPVEARVIALRRGEEPISCNDPS
jgi:hypothetical protein